MKKLLVGCLAIVVLAGVLLAVGSYLLYRAATPYIEDARTALTALSELAEIDAQLETTAPYDPPATGELTADQVERFVRVQEHVRRALGQRMKEIEEKYKQFEANRRGGSDPSLRELMQGLGDFAGVFVQARRFQVEALNAERFSQAEYWWVRNRILEAAGFEATSGIDFRKFEEAIREGTGLTWPADRRPTSAIHVPPVNRELVKPLLNRLGDWLPFAFFGL